MYIVIPDPPGGRNAGYSGELLSMNLHSWENDNYFKLSFSREENDLIRKYDENITTLGLIDLSFLHFVFKKNLSYEKRAVSINAPLTFMKKGLVRQIECFPFASSKELALETNCRWDKRSVVLEAHSVDIGKLNDLIAINAVTFGPEEEGFFKNQYSSVRKKGWRNLFKKSHLLTGNTYEELTNISKTVYRKGYLQMREPKECFNMFQFTKMLFHNQTLFEKNVFREALIESEKKEGKEQIIENPSFPTRIEKIYSRFEKEAEEINHLTFEFLRNKKIQKVHNPRIDFCNSHFRFNKLFSYGENKKEDVTIRYFLLDNGKEYHLCFTSSNKEKNEVEERFLEEAGETLKTYLSFCALLQAGTKEFLPEILSENV